MIKKLNYFSINLIKNNSFYFSLTKNNNFKESNLLQLDSSKAYNELKWKCLLNIDKTLEYTANWYINYYTKKVSLLDFSLNQVENYINENTKNKNH